MRYGYLGSLAAALMMSAPAIQAQELDELRMPEQLYPTGHSLKFDLRCKIDPITVAGKTIQARLYNGAIPGVTMHVKAGDTIACLLINDMPPNQDQDLPDQGNYPQRINNTNLHTHGLNVEPDGFSDNVLLSIKPGETVQYSIPIPLDHPAGSYWYHPHHHASTMPQVMSGMAGFIIVDDEAEKTPPDLMAVSDVQMIFQAVMYDTTAMTLPWPKRSSAGFRPYPTTVNTPILVNGMEQAKVTLAPGEVRRLRLCNALNSDILRVRMIRKQGNDSTTMEMTEIALDGIYLRRPRQASVIEIIPGDRSDVLIKAPNDGAEYWIVADWLDQQYNAKKTMNFVKLNITGEANDMTMPTTLPISLPKGDIPTDSITGHQDIFFSLVDADKVGPAPDHDTTLITRVFRINNTPFNHDVVNMTLKAGDVVEWYITNNSDDFHPFHIHVNEFQVMGVRKLGSSDSTVIAEPDWHDVIMLDTMATTRIRMRMSDVTGKTVMHCHYLVHEDWGMMNIIDIVPKTSSVNEAPWSDPELFPNPSVGRYTNVRVRIPDILKGKPVNITVHDITGAVVLQQTVTADTETTATLDVADMTAGSYYVLVSSGDKYRESSKLVLIR